MATALRSLPRFPRTAYLLRAKSTVPPSLERAVVVGVYSEDGASESQLSARGAEYDRRADGRVAALLKLGGAVPAGKARVLWGAGPDGTTVAAVGLGPRRPPEHPHEDIDLAAESVRRAAGAGVRALGEAGARSVLVDDMGAPRAAAEGATLAAHRYQEYRSEDKRKHVPDILPLDAEEEPAWGLGAVGAQCQNWARTLMERPGNKLTPTTLAQEVAANLEPLGVRVLVRDRAWAERERMGSFLSVARGSEEPPVFIEMHYDGTGDDSSPVVLVGKGVTFDTGGISLKPSGKMADMRGDMGGAAVVCGVLRAVAALKLPVRVVGLVPSTENMPDGRATKPGDVVVARNGRSVLVDNTDAEGRLILADALCYAHEFKPAVTLDLATLTGAMRVALGDAASGVFSREPGLVRALRTAAAATGDRVWHMPLYQRYSDSVTGFDYVDVHNMGKGTGGGSCTAAAFLREFAPPRWAHLDIASVMCDTEDQPYLGGPGMTGRPLRTVLEFIRTHAGSLQ